MQNIINKLAIPALGAVALTCGLIGNAQQAQAGALINGGFEQPVVNSNFALINESNVPGWDTTASDNLIEIQTRRLFHPGALNTDQYAELNANVVSSLFQDVATTAGNTMYWRFFHRGRQGVDTMRLSIIDIASNATLFTQTYSTDRTAWVEYTGTTVATGANTRWQFDSVSAAGGNPSIGNFLDEVYFDETPVPGAVPEPLTIVGVGTALGFGTFFKKKTAKANSKKK